MSGVSITLALPLTLSVRKEGSVACKAPAEALSAALTAPAQALKTIEASKSTTIKEILLRISSIPPKVWFWLIMIDETYEPEKKFRLNKSSKVPLQLHGLLKPPR
jgi:hypothetical protein